MRREAWAVRAERPHVLAIIALMELAAICAAALLWQPVTRTELVLAAFLASLSVTYSFLTVGWERVRQYLLLDDSPRSFANLLATWGFAAGLMLPPTLAAAVVAVAAAGEWPSYKMAGGRKLYRWTYSNAAAALSATVVSVIAHSELPFAARIPLCAAVWLGLMIAGIGAVMSVSGQLTGLGAAFQPRGLLIEMATLAVAVAEYGLRDTAYPLIWLSLPAALVLQRRASRAELDRRTYGGDRVMREEDWLMVARAVVDFTASATVMRVASADPKALRVVSLMCAQSNAIARYAGGSGLAILFPDMPPEQADGFAIQLQAQLIYHGISCAVVAASTPRDGEVLDSLLVALEAELLVAGSSTPGRSANPS